MVHAGIAPAWSIDDAIGHGAALSAALRAPEHRRLLSGMYGNQPDEWRDSLTGFERLRFITNACTRMRFCHSDGRLDFSETGPPGAQDPSLKPWFTLRDGSADGGRNRVRTLGDAPTRCCPFPATCMCAMSTPAACGAARSRHFVSRTTASSASAARATVHGFTDETSSRRSHRSWLRIATWAP